LCRRFPQLRYWPKFNPPDSVLLHADICSCCMVHVRFSSSHNCRRPTDRHSAACLVRTLSLRLHSLANACRHRNVNQWWYIAVLCVPGVAFTAWIVVVSYRYALDDSEHLVFCMYSACFLDYVGTLMFRSCAVLNGLTIACYVAIWLAMKQMKINSASMRRTVKSLVAIMICVIGSWTFNALLEIVMQYATTVGQTIWLTTRLGAVAINIGCGVNVVLLYNFSSDYNTAIVKELGPILHLAGKKFVSSMASVQRVKPENFPKF
ncbi:hypothetical protein AAVH_26912, partial [Aphelenchoides avenae]